MAKIPKSGIANAQTIQASHITNIIEALDGTGSYDVVATGSFTGSFTGDGSNITGVTAEWDGTHVGDASITGSLDVTGDVTASAFNGSGVDITGVISSSYAVSSSYSVSSSLAASASRAENIATANLTLDGDHTHTLGSNTLQIGGAGIIKLNPDTLVTTASFNHSGSFIVTDNITAASFNGLFSGSFSGSFEGNGSGLTGIDPFPYTGSAIISGSLLVTGSINGRFTKDSIAVDNSSPFAGNISGSGIYSGMNTMIDLSLNTTNTVRFTLSPITEYALGSSYVFYLSTTPIPPPLGSAFFRVQTSGGGEVFQGTITAFTGSILVDGDTQIKTNGGSGDPGDRITITKISDSIWQVEGSIKSGSSWTVS